MIMGFADENDYPYHLEIDYENIPDECIDSNLERSIDQSVDENDFSFTPTIDGYNDKFEEEIKPGDNKLESSDNVENNPFFDHNTTPNPVIETTNNSWDTNIDQVDSPSKVSLVESSRSRHVSQTPSTKEFSCDSTMGLHYLPHQKRYLAKKQGVSLTLMTVGHSGSGKTTFLNTLFATDIFTTPGVNNDCNSSLYSSSKGESIQGSTPSSAKVILSDNETISTASTSSSRYSQSSLYSGASSFDPIASYIINASSSQTESPPLKLDVTDAILYENDIELRLSVIDTPQFGDSLNNSNCWAKLVNFIESMHHAYMIQEEQPSRDNIFDRRVHACLYFIEPMGNELRPLDVLTMKALSSRVNLIPLISKADCFTQEELKAFKNQIMQTIKAQNIFLCGRNFNGPKLAEDLSFTSDIPFAVIGSQEQFETSEGKYVRGRKYNWGIADVENEDHCDFVKLRNVLLGENMLDLVQTTEVYYEKYRSEAVFQRLMKAKNDPNLDYNDISDIDNQMTGLEIQKLVSPIKQFYIPNYNDEISNRDKMSLYKKYKRLSSQHDERFKAWIEALRNQEKNLNEELQELYQVIMSKHQQYGITMELGFSEGTYQDGSIIHQHSILSRLNSVTSLAKSSANSSSSKSSSKASSHTSSSTHLSSKPEKTVTKFGSRFTAKRELK